MPLAKAAKKIKVPKERKTAPKIEAALSPSEVETPQQLEETLLPTELAAQPRERMEVEALPLVAAPPAEAQVEAAQPAEAATAHAEVAQLEAQRVAPQPPQEAEQETAEIGGMRIQPPPELEAPKAQPLPVQPIVVQPEAQPLEAQPMVRAGEAAVESAPRVVAVRRVTQPEAQPVEVRAPQRRFRVPRLKLRSASRLEGVEQPLPPMKGEAIKVPSGYLVIGGGVVRVYAEREGPWGPLQPLVDYRETHEIFVSERDGMVHVTAGIAGKRYEVELPRELVVERLAQRIAIAAGIPLSERNPQDSGEYHGWRVNLAMPQLAGGWQISAARVVKVEPLRSEPLLLARLVALAAAPNSLVFVGPPGSGKTTALIGVLNAVLELWPKLRVSIVEEEPEVAVQVSGPSVVRYFSFGDRTVTSNIRATRRYDRPDLLVVGELRGEEVPSWFEAAGSGIPVLTTAHSVGLVDAIKRLDTLIQASGLKASVLDAVRVWVVCGKTVSSSGIERGVKAVYVVTGEGFQPVYKAGKHLSEEDFLELLPPELQLAFGERGAASVYSAIKERLGARAEGIVFERLELLPFEEVLRGEGL